MAFKLVFRVIHPVVFAVLVVIGIFALMAHFGSVPSGIVFVSIDVVMALAVGWWLARRPPSAPARAGLARRLFGWRVSG